ncbi:hypothetical protein OGATHE_003032 [Ogataea polymorpha]|uniref:Uncharacterized protein n=1 Tax=Ogataea polymorpha TaxID=460523 RepID=A0A9P8T954_9ASCO|nr:hypothetical protein OGATHE_003032 [Ogataea polymorpha]
MESSTGAEYWLTRVDANSSSLSAASANFDSTSPLSSSEMAPSYKVAKILYPVTQVSRTVGGTIASCCVSYSCSLASTCVSSGLVSAASSLIWCSSTFPSSSRHSWPQETSSSKLSPLCTNSSMYSR